MIRYLFDTNICIYYLKSKFELKERFHALTREQKFISEITLAELIYGVKKSEFPYKNQQTLNLFLTGIQILPIYNSLEFYAEEKARLSKKGEIIDDFDLLIGVSAVVNRMILVTNNESHFNRIKDIEIENWTRGE